MKSYYAYIRVSTVKQGELGSSLDEQRSAISAYAQRHGLTIAEWFEETQTAAKQGRREFAKLTDLLKRGKASGVIIHKIDRSARNLKDWAGLGELIDAGIEVLFAHEGLDMQTRGGRLAADIQAVVAADFIRNLRQEVRKGFYGRLKQGIYPLRAPRGYLDQGKARAKTIDPIVGPLVAEAFRLYATCDYSLDMLRQEMKRRGLTQPNGAALSFNGISKMLRNPFYMGLIRLGTTGEVFEGKHEPLIAKELFDRVQAVLDGRLYPRVEKHEFVFRRLVKCAGCNRSLTGERQKGHVYYRCHDRACQGVSIVEERIEQAIAAELEWLRFDPAGLRDLRDLLEAEIAKERATEGERNANLERGLGLVEQRLSSLTDALIDGLIDKPTYEEKKSALLNRKRDLQDRHAGGYDSTFWVLVSQWFELGLVAQQGYETASPHEKRHAVALLGSNLVAEQKTPYFPMRFPFDVIGNWSKSKECEQLRGAVRTSNLIKQLAANNNEEVRRALRSPQSP